MCSAEFSKLKTWNSSSLVLICFIISLLTFLANAYPEESIIDTKISTKTVVHMSKCMESNEPISAKVYCDSNVNVNIDWLLFTTPCLNGFQTSDISSYFRNSRLSLLESSDNNYSLKSATLSVQCTPIDPITLQGSHVYWHAGEDGKPAMVVQKVYNASVPPPKDLVSITWNSGVYLLAIQVSCEGNTCSPPVRVYMEMKNRDGRYLSVLDFPYLPFSSVMTGVYFLLGITWLLFIARYWHQLTKIQMYTGVLLLLGLWEHLTLTAVYATIENTGTVSMAGLYMAELVSCIRRTLGRVLLLIVCLGYGVTQPNLGRQWFRRCLQIGLAYFLLLAAEGYIRTSQPRFRNSLLLLVTVVPLVTMDVCMMGWIVIYLARTLRATRVRYHAVKYRLYRNFAYLLFLLFIVSAAFSLFSLEYLKGGRCIMHWRYLWLDEAYWQVLFVTVMIAIMVLWRPTTENRFYAYSLLDQAGSDSDDPADVDVLYDSGELDPDSVVRSRAMDTLGADASETSKTKSDADGKVGTGKYSVQSPPSPSLMERVGMELDSHKSPPVWKTA